MRHIVAMHGEGDPLPSCEGREEDGRTEEDGAGCSRVHGRETKAAFNYASLPLVRV